MYRYLRHKHKSLNNKIILIENYSCNSKEELCKREQEIIEEHNNLLNKQRAYITEEQKKNYHKKYHKEYCENNKDIINQYNKEYRENNKERLNQTSKEFYENNKEYLKQKQKEHYKNNKIEILENMKKKVKCEFCNCEIQKNNLKRHQKTKKCLNNR